MIKKTLNSKTLTYLIELVLPTILSVLTYFLVDAKANNISMIVPNSTRHRVRNYYLDEEGIIGAFIILYFFIVIIEWFRRYKLKENNNNAFTNYIYIGVLLFIFLLSVFYINFIG